MKPRITGAVSGPRSATGPLRRVRRGWRSLRPPLVEQQEETDCGPASLLSVLRFWGGDESLPVVRALAGTEAHGTTLRALRDAANSLGLRARGACGTFEDLRREAMPCIAHLALQDGRAHFVVVYRASRDRIWIGDPAEGRKVLSRGLFEQRWQTRSVLLLSPGPGLVRRPALRWTRWLYQYLREEPAWMIQSLFLGTVAAGFGIGTAVFVRLLVDRFIPEANVSMILATGLALLSILLLRGFARYLRQLFLVRLNRAVSVRVNAEFLAHLYRLPLRFFESRATGDITSRIADGVKIQEGVLQLGGMAVVDILMVVGSSLCLFWVAPPLGMIAVVFIPAYLAVLGHGANQLQGEQAGALAAYGRVEAGYIDNVRGISDILGLGLSDWFARANTSRFASFARRVERLGTLHAELGLIAELTGGLLLVVGLSWGALLVVSEDLRLGELMAGYSLLAGLVPSAGRVAEAWAGLQQTAASARRFRDLMLSPPQPDASTAARTLVIRKGLRLENVAYSWPSGRNQLQGLDLRLPMGCVTGLMGPSGAGKSTLIHLLDRTYLPSRGSILVDEIPVEEFQLKGYRSRVAVFRSGTHVFRGTIADNVLLGRFPGGERSALASIESAGLGPAADRFLFGWSDVVGEGGQKLSQGERQFVGLMRAFVGNPDVLLVDEGLAGADPELRELILSHVLRYGRDHAVLFISHDERAVRRADRLLMLEGGRLRELAFGKDPSNHAVSEHA